jgi:hypothetical protein
MALSNKIENKNQIEFEPWKEAITKLGIKAAEMVKDKLDFPKEVKEWIKEFFDQMRGKVSFKNWVLQIEEDKIPDNLKWTLDSLNNKEEIKKLQEQLKPNYNPSHIPSLDWMPWPFTLWALLNNIWWYSNITKVEYPWESENKEEYSNFIWTLPEEVIKRFNPENEEEREKLKNNPVALMIQSFEDWNLKKETVQDAQKFLDGKTEKNPKSYYLGHKSSRDWVPWQHTQNAILNYASNLV